MLGPAPIASGGRRSDAVLLGEARHEPVAEVDLDRDPRQEERDHVDETVVVFEAEHHVGSSQTSDAADQVVDVGGTELEVSADLGDVDGTRTQSAGNEASDGAGKQPVDVGNCLLYTSDAADE